MQKLCQSEETVEFETPDGGTLTYGPCKKHGWFMMMVHCPTSDVHAIAESILEAAKRIGGQHGNPGARKTPRAGDGPPKDSKE